jgi:hypothetical protein
VATGRQLVETGRIAAGEQPGRPWLRIQGTGDATTLWYAVMRKEARDSVFIGALCLRHSDHHASLLQGGWHEVPVDELRLGDADAADERR